MAPILYSLDGSPAVRSVYMTAAAIGLELEKKQINLMAGEHLTPEYLKLNPQHTVPTLEDGDFVVWDSHAINSYLIGTYAKEDSMYPKDLKKRAIVDQRLHFDSGVLFPKLAAVVAPILRQGVKTVPKDKADGIVEGYTTLETLLGLNKYVAGEGLTVADMSICTTVTTLNVLVPLAENRFPNICKWLGCMKSLPYYATTNEPGLEQLAAVMKSKMA